MRPSLRPFFGHHFVKNMKPARYISGLAVLMSLLSLLSFSAYGADFAFNNSEVISKWRFSNVQEARFTGGGLLLEGVQYVRIAPPEDFRVPAGRVAVKLRFKTPRSIICNIRIRAEDGWQSAKTVKVKVVDNGESAIVLPIYFGNHGGGVDGTYINDFVIEFFSPEKISVRLDGLRFYEPTGAGLLSLLWGEFWAPDFITGMTVGFVSTPEAGGVGFISMLYVLIGLAFITVLIVYRLRGRGLSLRKAAGLFVIIFLLASLLFTLRMDYNWLSIFSDDVNTLSPVDVEKRIHLVNNRDLDVFFDFIDFVKKTVPPGKSVRPATIGENTPLGAVARYYLLPLEDSEEADFLWSYARALRLDANSGTLYDGKGKVIAPKVRLFAAFAENAGIYEVIK